MNDAGRDAPIGIFDSGVGGLTVFSTVRDALPHEHFVYLGDTARVPYGTRGADTVRRYALNVVSALTRRGCKAIVIACNTASAYAMDAVRDEVDVPVIDVIDPVARAVSRAATSGGTIGVLGTRGTVASGAYLRALARHGEMRQIAQQACPLFVPLAEEGWTEGPVVEEIARTYLGELYADARPEHLILGCTHYPLLANVIRSVAAELAAGPVQVHDSAHATATALVSELEAHGLRRTGATGNSAFLVTDDPAGFERIAHRFVRPAPGHVEHVDL